ncbi:hypothetical protein [Microlunatus sp. Y2014]|uniref:hypothetical protein n=1 Tax=Microlunatus sp. Y2014 TaxID=3418488 RepID=UPI003DA7244E
MDSITNITQLALSTSFVGGAVSCARLRGMAIGSIIADRPCIVVAKHAYEHNTDPYLLGPPESPPA